ncbi:MAG: hypothetical protein EAX86_08550 [Candidatus Heimdallarchaeota archaeon]|nr:hypothetical protein [Candidatus Heimdallarchaeota archaeon]
MIKISLKKFNGSKKLLISFLLLFLSSFLINSHTISKEFFPTDFVATSFIADISNNTIFSSPSLSSETPVSNESVNVNILISDTDGIQNATLFWQYSSINTTLFNTSMLIDENAEVIYETDYPFDRNGYITDTGVETPSVTNWMFGETIYEGTEGEVLSNIDLTIIRSGGGGNTNSLVYIKIQAKNITSGFWETIIEEGSIGGTSEVVPYPYDFTSTQSVAGYRIYAITYKNTHNIIQPPRFDHLYLYRNEYSGEILAPDEPTLVNYYIQIFDDLNHSAQSDEYSFLMDWAPDVIVYKIPTVLKGSSDYILNVSVSDEDGVNTINHSTVEAHYRLEGELEWNSVTLTHIIDFGGFALYNGTIPGSLFQNRETFLYFMVNATDIIDESPGYTGTSGLKTVILDNLNPRLINLDLDGGVIVPGVENLTLASSVVNITADFEDPSGILSASIYYSIGNNGIYTKLLMENTTNVAQSITTSSYFVTLPATNTTAYVSYFFETCDYLNNKGNTSLNLYYADGAAPLLDSLIIIPDHISNNTDVTILYTISDYTGVRQSVLWYSYDDGLSWTNTVGYEIVYDDHIDYQESFTFSDLPYIIVDDTITVLNLDVTRKGLIGYATLLVNFTHEKSTDVRMWISNGIKNIMIFDRVLFSGLFEVDLLEIGFVQADFDDAVFSLIIEDYSLLYSGIITDFKINLLHYAFPEGYDYYSIIPASQTDATIEFFITLTDNLWNTRNTSSYYYYSDGIAPSLSTTIIPSPYDLHGENSVMISATVTDEGGIAEVEFYYKYMENDDWTIACMSYSDTTYQYYIPLYSTSGHIYYQIRAYDYSGITTISSIYSFEYINGLGPIVEFSDIPYPSPLDLQGASNIEIRVNVTDLDGVIESVNLLYRFDVSENYSILAMNFDSSLQLYASRVTIPSINGILSFKIIATDNLGLETETSEQQLEYVNGSIEPSSGVDFGTFLMVLALVSVPTISAAILVYWQFILKKKKSLNLPTPPE